MIIKISEVKGKPFNFETVQSFAKQIGCSVTYVHTLTNKYKPELEGTMLDICYPMPNSDSEEDAKTGPLCIVLNDKAKKILKDRKEKLKEKSDK